MTPTTLVYAVHDGEELSGDLYRPVGRHPVTVAVHGGSWRGGRRANFRYWGEYLAAHGYALFAISYRLSRADRPTYPAAVHDVRAAVQFVKANAAELGLDGDRVGLWGDSAGAQLAALVALAGEAPPFAAGNASDPFANVSTQVKVLIGNYGVYDLAAHWHHELGFAAANTAQYLGASLLDDRHRYFEGSPLSYVTRARNALPVHLSYGTEDTIVDRRTQSEPFFTALTQAGYFVRTVVVQGEGHYWASDPIDEPGSASGRLAPRVLRFLQDHL